VRRRARPAPAPPVALAAFTPEPGADLAAAFAAWRAERVKWAQSTPGASVLEVLVGNVAAADELLRDHLERRRP